MNNHLPLFLQTKSDTMDINYYFNQVDFPAYHNQGHLNWKSSLGALIEKNTVSLSEKNIVKLNIAIVGVPFDSRKENTFSPEAPDKIRTELYQLVKFDNQIRIADFGNLKPASSARGNYQALRDIVDYLNELNIVTIIIGGSQDLSIGVCEAFTGNRYFSFSTIDAFLDIRKAKEPFDSTNYLTRLFAVHPHLFQFNLIAFQGHYTNTGYFKRISTVSNHIRLGNLRDEISLAEPEIRNTDFLSFDICSVKHSDAPGSTRVTPNGLRSEEACQLAKYAGLSGRLKVFGLFDVFPENDRDELTVKLSAQIIWYFIEGFINRDIDDPATNENCRMFQVEVENVDKPITFYRNSITGQWWMQVETNEKRNLYFACSEKEYRQASSNEIPELWLSYIQKTDELLK